MILIYAPPVGDCSDGLSLADRVDAVLVIADSRPRALATELVALDRMRAPVAGVVLSGPPRS